MLNHSNKLSTFAGLIVALCCLFLVTAAGPKENEEQEHRYIEVTTQGIIGESNEFVSLGVTPLVTAEESLANYGGYSALYNKFKQNQNFEDVWQEAIAFKSFLNQYDDRIQVSTNSLAQSLTRNIVFNSNDDTVAFTATSQLKRNLGFQEKINFLSGFLDQMVSTYDYDRLGNGPTSGGSVTCRQMIEAYQNGTKAGVCRDMSACAAQFAKQLGLDQTFIISHPTQSGRHAPMIIQDPDNPKNTVVLNYGYVNTNEGSNSLDHLTFDTILPDYGINRVIYDIDGRPLGTIPANLGLALQELSGGSADDLDPMLRSENDLARAVIHLNEHLTAGGGIAETPDGNTIIAMHGAYEKNTHRQNQRVALLFYKNNKATRAYGPTESYGAYIDLKQKLKTNIVQKQLSNGGKIYSQIYGQFRLQAQIQTTSTDYHKGINIDHDHELRLGHQSGFTSSNGNTNITTDINAGFVAYKNNVSNENFRALTPVFQDLTLGLAVAHKLLDRLKVFTNTKITRRNRVLGTQGRQELGINYYIGQDGQIRFLVGAEGQIQGQTVAFVPGSLRKNYAELGLIKNQLLEFSGGAYCDAGSLDNCRAQGSLTYRFYPFKN